MKVVLSETFSGTALGAEVEELLSRCVQCGQCTFTCPTFRLLDDEWDGPRGRIFLIQHAFEGRDPDEKFLPPAYSIDGLRGRTIGENLRVRLDRCLTCRSCEANCPQGVRYGRLLDLGRVVAEREAPRPWRERLARRAFRQIVPYRRRFAALLRAGRFLRPILPSAIKDRVPSERKAGFWPRRRHARKMVVWQGCAQPALAPEINAAAASVLDRFGIALVPGPEGCCGALSYHLAATEEALALVRRSIDRLWPYVIDGVEAIVLTASGCGAHVRDYATLMKDDPAFRLKAARISELTRDIAEIVSAEMNERPAPARMTPPRRLVFQASCSLQHGQKLNGVVEKILKQAGYKLLPVSYPFMCCGAAGSYSVFQPENSKALRKLRLEAMLSCRPDAIATANVGCLVHLAEASPLPVHHWIELLDKALADADAAEAYSSL